ncbi:hypothetical protein LPJ57_005254 [Coemansia sp. RSA 486]|nr:hypothetical protein LPJ57_005254 [Coemansia sp. RSA 486]
MSLGYTLEQVFVFLRIHLARVSAFNFDLNFDFVFDLNRVFIFGLDINSYVERIIAEIALTPTDIIILSLFTLAIIGLILIIFDVFFYIISLASRLVFPAFVGPKIKNTATKTDTAYNSVAKTTTDTSLNTSANTATEYEAPKAIIDTIASPKAYIATARVLVPESQGQETADTADTEVAADNKVAEVAKNGAIPLSVHGLTIDISGPEILKLARAETHKVFWAVDGIKSGCSIVVALEMVGAVLTDIMPSVICFKPEIGVTVALDLARIIATPAMHAVRRSSEGGAVAGLFELAKLVADQVMVITDTHRRS